MATTASSDVERAATDIVRRLAAAGHRTLWAGGCVRDRLMGRPAKDIDIVTAAPPAGIEAVFPDAKGVGRSFGVLIVVRGGHAFEIATFRRDEAYEDGRRPSSVSFCDERTDASRRDFTINGLFYDPLRDEVIDYVGGRADLERRLVRAIGDPARRFAEDHLRLLRAVRFCSTLEFQLDPATADAIRERAASIRRISAERIQTELTRLLTESPRAGRGLLLLRDVGLLREVLPEVAALEGVEQPPEFHPEGDVWTHTVLMLDAMRTPSADLAWAVLLHDVGKPPTARMGPGADGRPRWRFDEHDRAGAEIARRILERLRMPTRRIENVVQAVAGHMRFREVARMRRAKLRRLLASPTFEMELELHRLDCEASHRDVGNVEFLRRAQEEWRREPVLPPPLVNGRDVMALGVPEGPRTGRWVRWAYERQLESPGLTRDALLADVTERLRRENASGRPPAPRTE
jgi:poly(A) polymerase